MDPFFITIFFILGLLFGSFLNVVILRLPGGETLSGRSHCFTCKHVLGTLDLVPVFSYLFLRGKCRYCGNRISPRYFIVEIVTGLLFAWAFIVLKPADAYGFMQLLKTLLVICVCVVTFVVDLEHYVILENVVLPSAAIIAVINLVLDLIAHRSLIGTSSLFLSGIGGAFIGALPIFIVWYASKWKGGEAGMWMGFGDVELMLFLGAAAGIPLAGLVLFIGILLGGAVSIFLLAAAGKNLKSHVPFGTFLAPAAIVVMFYGDKILHWYLALLGI